LPCCQNCLQYLSAMQQRTLVFKQPIVRDPAPILTPGACHLLTISPIIFMQLFIFRIQIVQIF
jgi:hypothetical protein